MKKETYVSPKLTFEEIALDKPVANTCWGYHGTGTNLYVDLNGKDNAGFYSFQIGGGNCSLTLTNVAYYSGKEKNEDGQIVAKYDHAVAVNDDNAEYRNVYNKLVAAGGAQGNPFAGEGQDVFTDISRVS